MIFFVKKTAGFSRGFTYMKIFKENVVLRGATVLGIGAFISKLLGALYRIPLTNLLGGKGIGLYQSVFPVYALLLDFSGHAMPSAISKIIAQGGIDREERAKKYFYSSLKLLTVFGLIFSSFMFAFASPISRLQGAPDATKAYLYLSPSIFLVALISCFRGYFQGLMNMRPTAISQIIEQTAKLFLGIIFVKFSKSLPNAVAGATFAITISEFIALIYLLLLYKKHDKNFLLVLKPNKLENKRNYTQILRTALPITLVGIAIPLSQVIDSFLTLNLIGSYRADATVLYGLLSGVALTVINLPVSICHGVSTVAIPSVSAENTPQKQYERAKKILVITVIMALPCAIFCLMFTPFIVSVLYRSLSLSEKTVAINLIRLLSPCIFLLSLVQTQNAVLIGKGKLYSPIFSLLVGVIIKTVLNVILMNIPTFNIYGGGVALIACYFFTCLINFIMIFNFKVKNESSRAYRRQYAG